MFNKKRIKELEKEIVAKEELLDKQRAVLETQLREIESLRKHILKDKQYDIRNPLLIILGFRRLLYNPYASHPKAYTPKEYIPRLNKGG